MKMFTASPTIIFDLGGVCFTDGTSRAITVISEKYLLDINAVSNVFCGDIGTEYRENKMTNETFWSEAKKRWKIENVNVSELSQIWLEGYIPISEVIDIILCLRKAGCKILYLSGSTNERVEYLKNKYNIFSYFDDGVFSFEIGARKPSYLPYKTILDKSSNAPQNCIFIDNQEKYLLPAKNLGMHTILFHNPNKLRLDLRKLGLAFL
jgi:FMN phosphatase YigB (HAD superfamily)